MQKEIFDCYVGRLILAANKYQRALKNNDLIDENYKKYDATISEAFHFYRDLLNELGFSQFLKNDCFREPTKKEKNVYECSLNVEGKIEYPLVRMLEYRNKCFPEYLDDYGMETFIEFTNYDGRKIQIRTNDVDWDYELDRVLDCERLLNIDAQQDLEKLFNDPWFKLD